jgi:hypothetical protein
MSYKSNRNWTLPAPDVSLVQPNVCDNDPTDDVGVLTGNNQTMWVTYRLDSTGFTNSLHCNYYTKVVGPDTGCTISAQNVSIKFDREGLSFSRDTLELDADNAASLARIIGRAKQISDWLTPKLTALQPH